MPPLGTPLTCADLERARDAVRESPVVREKASLAQVLLATRIIQHFLGNDWLKKAIDPALPRAGFIVPTCEGADATGSESAHLTYLAELLFNLQDVEGFAELVERMGGNVRPNFTELHVGRLLRLHGTNFRFVSPRGHWGNDYDLAITHGDGLESPAETKLKLRSPHVDEDAVVDALEMGRPQLPPNAPGLMFLMVPRSWFDGSEARPAERAMAKAALEFLKGSKRRKGTSRVVSVTFYTAPSFADDALGDRIKIVSNPENALFPNRNWDLFAGEARGSWLRLREVAPA